MIRAISDSMSENYLDGTKANGPVFVAQGKNRMAGSTKRIALTKRQREIYEFLRDKIINRGYGPTVREIGLQFNIRSPNGVMCHLKALERKGLISREQNMSRAIQLSDAPQNRLSVSLIGTAATNGPIQPSVGADEVVSFGAVFEGPEIACLRVEGNGFLPLNVASGDFIIVNREATPQPGCFVAAMDDRHTVVLCSVQEGTNQLVSAISGTQMISPRQVMGVITGVIRKFRIPVAPAAETT
jgi:repressor LexA